MILQLTDCSEDTCEAEVIHSIEREQVIQKLLPFFLTAQESVTLVKLPGRNKHMAFVLLLLKKHQVSQKVFESQNIKSRVALNGRYDSPTTEAARNHRGCVNALQRFYRALLQQGY